MSDNAEAWEDRYRCLYANTHMDPVLIYKGPHTMFHLMRALMFNISSYFHFSVLLHLLSLQ